MAFYAIFKYVLSKTGEGDLFSQDMDHPSASKTAQDYFGNLFVERAQLNAYKTKEDGEVKQFPNEVLRKTDDVIVMRFCNNKNVTRWQQYEKLTEESNPYCHIVIDNRPNVCIMAIEKESSFGSPDFAAEVLQLSLCRLLNPYHLAVTINPMIRIAEFWEYIDEQRLVNHDRIRKVTFDFPNPKVSGPLIVPAQMEGRLKALSTMLCQAGAAKGQYSMEASAEGTINLVRTKRDMAQMVDLCCHNGYNIAVNFQYYGVFRYNDKIKAMQKMNEQVLQDFIDRQLTTDKKYGLIVWLDSVRQFTENFKDAKTTPTPRKRGNKK